MPENPENHSIKGIILNLIQSSLAIPADKVTDQLAYGDLPEWDSLGHMNIMMALEEKFGIQITSEVIMNLVSVEKIINYLSEYEHD